MASDPPMIRTARLLLRPPVQEDLSAWAALAARLGSTYRGPGRLPPPWDKERIDFWGQTAAQWRQRRGGAG